MNPLALCGVKLASIVAYGCMLQMVIDTMTVSLKITSTRKTTSYCIESIDRKNIFIPIEVKNIDIRTLF